MSTHIQEEFIKSMKELDPILIGLGFSHISTTRNGYATYADYKSADNMQASFMLGPSDWHVELLLIKGGKEYAFKDLLEVSAIAQWIKENKYQEPAGDGVKGEVSWFVELLRFLTVSNIAY